MLDSLMQDARYALRVLARSPVFTATAALSLAVGIGANTAIFSVASAMLLRPLPGLSEPGRLVDIGRQRNGDGFDTASYPNYQDIRRRVTTLSGVYAHRVEPEAMSLTDKGEAERIYGSVVSANYFEVLGTRPSLGRLLRDDDDAAGGSAVAVISREFWERRFASDPSIVGRPVTLNGTPFIVVGVAPRGFQGTTLMKADVWVPMSMLAQAVPRMSNELFTSRRAVWLFLGGRLAPGVSLEQANAELTAIGAALAEEFPADNRSLSYRATTAAIVPGRTTVIAGFLALLMAIVGLVLLIACVNVAGMLLARGVERRREIAVRLAVGAGRGRLVRQLLTESALLFLAGGLAGVALSQWLTRLLLGVLPTLPVPISLEIVTDWRVVAFAAVLSLVAAVLSGLAPALQASRADLAGALKTDAFARAADRLRLRNAFVIGQVALSMILIVAAGLFLRALQRAADTDPGFDQNHVEVVSLDLSMAGYREGTGQTFARGLLERIRGLNAVDSASLAIDLPLDGGRFGLGGFTAPGVQPPAGRDRFAADWNVVDRDYFRALRLPIVAGRDFSEADTAQSMPVAIVNEAFVKRVWPGSDGVGKQIEARPNNAPVKITIVGVTKDAKLVWLTSDPEPFIYVPFSQRYMSTIKLVVRSTDGRSVIPDIRTVVRSMNPNLPLSEALPLEQITALSTIPQRVAAAVAGSLGIVALLLAAIGIYGVTAYAVGRRTREIGIRVALGADRQKVMRLVLRQGLTLAAAGIAIGIAVAAAASRLLESLLFGVPGLDPVTFGAAGIIFASIALAAAYFPARRALRIEPVVALRAE